MKLPQHLIIATLVAAIAVPSVSFAAKADRKKKDKTPAVSFSAADKDTDGFVTQGEYVAAFKGTAGDDAAKTQFASKDKDADGKLTKEEFGAVEKKKGRKKKNQE